MATDKTIKNVVLLGHSGSGKTTFAETMLFETGAINRRGSVEEGNTVSDFTMIEKERGNSIFTSLMHVEWKDSKINILDTPGLDDFVGEVVSAMKVTDTALMLLNAGHGVEVGTELLWEYVEKFHLPTMFVINQIDHDKADFENTLSQTQARFGSNVIPIQYPLNQGAEFNTIIDTLRMVMYVFDDEGGKPKKEPIPDSEIQKAQEWHNALVEAAAENDEELMERFFEHGSLTEEELAQGLTIALANQEIFPVFIASGVRNMGSGRIMGFINDIAPSPTDRPPAKLTNGETLACDRDDATTLFIYKTMSEPRVGNVSYFKVYSGTVHSGDELINQKNDSHERLNQIFVSNGKNREQINHLYAGDIGATVKLKNCHTNNTLNTKGSDRAIEPIHFPKPKMRTAVEPPSKNDFEKLAKALHTIQEEDPTIILEHAPELKQTILHAQGQLHLDVMKYRVSKVYGVDMHFIEPRISYRETITGSTNEAYRHKKQSGGAGQFAEVHMRIESYTDGMPDPHDLNVRNKEVIDLPWGGKLAFLWCIVGGAIDSKFTNAIKKGIMQKMEEGPLTGSPCMDIRVCVYDGKMHPVDSNDMAFQIAATMAFKNGFKNASPQILEPMYDVEILCSDEVMGDVMSDLQSRRAMIMGMDADGHYQLIKARAPLAELYKYSSTLRSLTQGKAKFSREFAEFAIVTPDIQQKLMEAYRLEEAEMH
jgi:elongation factor G